MSVRVFAPAKINLTLRVGQPRADGLHPLQSLVMFADVGDWVEAKEGADLRLEVIDGPFAAQLVADDNLVLRAGQALKQATGCTRGAALRLTKNLPVASGLGGGSSDAAAALKALNALWRAGVNEADLAALAMTLGADVPVCLAARSAWMTGVGEHIAAMHTPEVHAVLVNPSRPLATGAVFAAFDAIGLGAPLDGGPPVHARVEDIIAAALAAGNDLWAPALSIMPALAEVSEALLATTRARAVGLSGSGATMFALYDAGGDAVAAAEAITRTHPAWWVAPTRLGARLDAASPAR